MNIPSILNVALGLFFIYLLLSLFASEIQEFGAGYLFDWRAKNLHRSIEVILGTPATNLLYQHPLIKSWKDYKQLIRFNSIGPSYIPSSTFALALISLIVEESGVQPQLDSLTIQDFINAIDSKPIQKLLNSDQSKLLKILAVQARNQATDSSDLKVLEQEIMTWFEQSMTRASGVYKRQVKLTTLAIGLIAAIVLNVDTLNISYRLFQEPVLQQQLSQTINTVLSSEDYSTLRDCLDSPQNSPQLCQNLKDNFLYSSLFDFSTLPLGWGRSNINQQFNLDQITELRQIRPSDLIKALIGWLLTAIAISMGSSFWFDLLNKLINVRNTGSKPQICE